MEQLERVGGMEPRDIFALEAMKFLMSKNPDLYSDLVASVTDDNPSEVWELDLSVRASNALDVAGIRTVADLCNKCPQDLLALRSFGRTSLREVKRVLELRGLSLKTERSAEQVDCSKKLGRISYAIADAMMSAR